MKTSSHAVLVYLRSLVHRHADTAKADGELLRRFSERRDEDAFATLLQRHGPMVLNAAQRLTGDEQLAEDVFQATFLLLSRKATTIRRAEALPCWLHRVVRRLAVEARRAQARRREQEAQVQPRSCVDPLEELSAREFVAVLDEEIGKLPESQRAALILCCLEGLSQEEAAKRLGCSAAAVKSRLERGRNRLRQRLEKRGLTLPAVLGGTLLLAGSTSPVPATLVKSTLQAAVTGNGMAPAVAALLEEAMRTMLVNKLKTFGAVVMLLALSGTGVGMMTLRPQAAKENNPPASADDNPLSAKKRVDPYGDPLPKDAVMRLGMIQRRAVGAALAVSADGKSIIGVRGNKSIHIWDAATGELRQTRELPGDSLNSSTLSQDGRWLARTAYDPERLEIWDVQSGRKERELTIQGNSIILSAISADGKRVAAVAIRPANGRGNQGNYLIRVWNITDGKEIFSKDVRSNVRINISFSPDGKRLLASFASVSEGLYCWDIATGRQLWQNKKFGWSRSMVFTRDGKILSPFRVPQVLDLATGQLEKIEKAPPPKPDGQLTLTPDGRTLLISATKEVIVWDMVQGKELRTLSVASEEVVVTPDSKFAITNNGMLQRWDLTTGKALWSDTSEWGHVGEVTAVKFSADGKRLVSASTDGTVRLWDATTSRPLRIWRGQMALRLIDVRIYPHLGIKTLDISADGRRVVSAGSDEGIKLWSIDSDKEGRTINLPPREKGEMGRRFYHVQVSPDGRRVAGIFGPSGGMAAAGQPPPKLTDKLAFWDAETGNLLKMHPVEMGGGTGVLSPDGNTLLTGNGLIDVRSTKKLAELPGMSRFGPTGVFSRDGALIVGQAEKQRQKNGRNYVDSDGLRIWEAATGKVVAHLKTKSWVAQTAFHPSNRFIVTNDLGGIHIREVLSGEVVARFTMPETIRAGTTSGSYAACLAFSPDGRRMATGLPDSTILLWDIHLPEAPVNPLSAKELEARWTDLADDAAAKAWEGVDRLAATPKEALAFLRGRVRPYPTAPAEVTRKLLADLDSDSFEIREAAVKRLKELGPQAEPALRAALKDKPSLEQRRRIEELLADLTKVPSPPTAEGLRQLRALIVLERINSPGARRLLAEVAKGPESTRLTRQARAALACRRE